MAIGCDSLTRLVLITLTLPITVPLYALCLLDWRFRIRRMLEQQNEERKARLETYDVLSESSLSPQLGDLQEDTRGSDLVGN